jgi:hypothetical protein
MEQCCGKATRSLANRGNMVRPIHEFYVQNTTESWAFRVEIVFYGDFRN